MESAPQAPSSPEPRPKSSPEDQVVPAKRSLADPLMILALGAALLGATSTVASDGSSPSGSLPPQGADNLRYEIPCPPGQLPDEGICVPVSSPGPMLENPDGAATPTAMVPLRADRPRDFDGYVLPVVLHGVPRNDVPGDDVPGDGPPTVAREEPTSEIGPAIRVGVTGAIVQSLRLEDQEGATEVVFASHGPPGLVITAHRVRRERGQLTFLLVHGDLAEVHAPLLEAMPTAPLALELGAKLGKAGAPGLLLGLRQVRGDVTLEQAVPDLAPEMVFASDPRNALPRRR